MSDDLSQLSAANHGGPVHSGVMLTSRQKRLDPLPKLNSSPQPITKGVREILQR